MRFRCGFVQVPVNWNVVVISPCFAIFKNVVHSLEWLGVSPGSKLCATLLNIAKYFKTLRCGSGAVAFIFFNLLLFKTICHKYKVVSHVHCLFLTSCILKHLYVWYVSENNVIDGTFNILYSPDRAYFMHLDFYWYAAILFTWLWQRNTYSILLKKVILQMDCMLFIGRGHLFCFRMIWR